MDCHSLFKDLVTIYSNIQKESNHILDEDRSTSMKGENQQDATIRCLLSTSVSTCFGHHYSHLQVIKGPVTASGVLFWFCWIWLVAVVGRCLAGCDHYEL
jgi:hypothetical protein